MIENTKTDVIFKEFWRQNERFADLFNTVIFKGKEVIRPEKLSEMDTDVSGTIEMKDYKETLTRTRDVVKKMAYGVEFVVMGIENQEEVHYAMPLRGSAAPDYQSDDLLRGKCLGRTLLSEGYGS